MVILIHQSRRDAETAGFDVLELLAIPVDEAVHRRIARHHECQDGRCTLADDVGFGFALALGRRPLLSRRDKPLAELLRQRGQQQIANAHLILATQPLSVIAQMMVHCGGVLPQARDERPHVVRVAAPGFPHLPSNRLRRRDAKPLLQQVEHTADAAIHIERISGCDTGRRQHACQKCQFHVREVPR